MFGPAANPPAQTHTQTLSLSLSIYIFFFQFLHIYIYMCVHKYVYLCDKQLKQPTLQGSFGRKGGETGEISCSLKQIVI